MIKKFEWAWLPKNTILTKGVWAAIIENNTTQFKDKEELETNFPLEMNFGVAYFLYRILEEDES